MARRAPAASPGFLKSEIFHFFFGAGDGIRDLDRGGVGKIGYPQAVILKRIVLHVDAEIEIVPHAFADLHEAVG